MCPAWSILLRQFVKIPDSLLVLSLVRVYQAHLLYSYDRASRDNDEDRHLRELTLAMGVGNEVQGLWLYPKIQGRYIASGLPDPLDFCVISFICVPSLRPLVPALTDTSCLSSSHALDHSVGRPIEDLPWVYPEYPPR